MKQIAALLAVTTVFSGAALAEAENKFHGSLGTNVEVEKFERSDGVNEGKIKYTMAQGNFRHDDLPGWDFGFYSAREELFSGDLLEADFNRGVNAIQEVSVNRNFGTDWGNIGFGAKLAAESIDKRITPGAKVFGSYRITDKLDFHGYAYSHVEYKRDAGEYHLYEFEPGFGYQIADNMGAWVNFRYKEGIWEPKSGDKEVETEVIVKPGIWYNFGKLGASLWAEIGQLEKENDRTGAHLWSEDYAKVGVSANYPLSAHWSMFTTVSYKTVDFEAGADRDEMDGDLTFGVIGVNYNF